jgi:hypothetical protein
MTSVIGITNGSKEGATSFRPSTAESTELAGDHGVSVEKRRAGDAEPEQERRAASCPVLAERHQREGAALAVVVGAQQHEDVFQRHDERQRPQDEREHADHRFSRRRPAALGGRDGFAERIKRARADVAVDDSQRA